MRPVFRALLLVAASGPAGEEAVPAGDVREERAEASSLVFLLGHQELKIRQQAFDTLLERGVREPETVLPFPPDRSDDPEIQSRCEDLRVRIPWLHKRNEAERLMRSDPAVRKAACDLIAGPTEMHMDELVSVARGDVDCASLVLAVALAGEVDNEVKRACLAVLWKRGGLSAHLDLFLEDPDPVIRVYTATALANGRKRQFIPRIASLLGDPDHGVRRAAVCALQVLEAAPEASRIEKLLEDKEASVRSAAGQALARLQGKAAMPRLAALCRDSDPQVRYEAVFALSDIGDPCVASCIARLLDDPVEETRRGAAGALGKLCTGERWDLRPGGIAEARAWWERHRNDPEFRAPVGK